MKTRSLPFQSLFLGVLSAVLALCGGIANAQSSTAFTYQGRLDDGGAPATGVYDIRFTVWNVISGPGATLAPSVCFDDVDVINGLFQVDVDFGAGSAWLNAADAFLQVDVRADERSGNCGAGTYTSLLPRTRFTAAPRSASTRGITVTADGKIGLGGATPDRGLTMWGGVNVRDSGNQGVYLLTDELVIANADNEDQVYRYDAPPLDRHTFFAGASPALSIDSVGRVGIGLESPAAPVHVRSLPDRTNYVRWQASRRVATGPSVQSPPSTPATASAVPGTAPGEWTSLPSARAIDGAFATAIPTFGGDVFVRSAQTIRLSGLNFAIPANATITGISVSVATSNTIAYACEGSKGAQVRITPRTPSKVGTTLTAGVPLSGAGSVTIGGSAQPFGTSWTRDDVNQGDLSIDVEMLLKCQWQINNFPNPPAILPCSCGPTGLMRLDGISVIIHYSVTEIISDPIDWSAGINTGDTSFLVAPTTDLSSPLLVLTRDGRMGVGALPTSTHLLDVAGTVRCISLTETSTARFKTDVSSLENPLDTVLALRPVRFRWDQAHGGHADIGLLAEQVREVAPALVASGEGGDAAGLNYGRVGVLAVGAIQELKAQHDRQLAALQARADQLNAENDELKDRLTRLEKALEALAPNK